MLKAIFEVKTVAITREFLFKPQRHKTQKTEKVL